MLRRTIEDVLSHVCHQWADVSHVLKSEVIEVSEFWTKPPGHEDDIGTGFEKTNALNNFKL